MTGHGRKWEWIVWGRVGGGSQNRKQNRRALPEQFAQNRFVTAAEEAPEETARRKVGRTHRQPYNSLLPLFSCGLKKL